jgi:hypothetical protein
LFNGNAASYLRIPNTNAFDFGTENFTIEWYQYQTDSNQFPRIFQVGSYGEGSINIGVSIGLVSPTSLEALFAYWSNGTFNNLTSIPRANYINKWVHFAISRSNGTTKIFMNGVSIGSFSDSVNYDGNRDLVIGNEASPSLLTAFGGYITYFTWLKGKALYTDNFTVSNTYPPSNENYILYLKAGNFAGSLDFAGSLGNTVQPNSVSTIQMVPPNFVSNSDTSDTNTSQVQNRISLGPLFTNNAQVYYKPGSLASCGVGSVRNSRNKLRRI